MTHKSIFNIVYFTLNIFRFRSSDRQSILLHIIKSQRNVGGAQLAPSDDACGAAIIMMFPVHMVLRLRELRRTWSTAFFCCRDPPQR